MLQGVPGQNILTDSALAGLLILLPTRSDDRGVLRVPVAILPSCQHMEVNALQLHKHDYSSVVKIRNTSEAILRPQYTQLGRRSIVL